MKEQNENIIIKLLNFPKMDNRKTFFLLKEANYILYDDNELLEFLNEEGKK